MSEVSLGISVALADRSGNAAAALPDSEELGTLRVVCSDGCEISARRRGAGPSLWLFVHGACEGSYVWDDFLSRSPLPHVAAMDLRGHGESDWDPRSVYREATHAEDVVRVLNTLGAAKVCIIGHSLGASVAIRVAAIDRRVRKVVIVDFGPGMRQDGLVQASVQSLKLLKTYESVADYAAHLASERPLLRPSRVEALARAALRRRSDGKFEPKYDPSLMREDNDTTTPDAMLLAQLRGITCPTLILRGTGSAVFPLSSAQRMAAAMPQAQLRNIPMAGHAVMLDNPQGFADAVLPFLMDV